MVSTTAKAVAQYVIEKQDSSGASVLSRIVAAYSYATTAADVRIWTTLPKDFQIARFPKPKDGKLKITPADANPFEIDIPGCNNAIVYVRITANQAKPIFEVMTF
jgi:hypothetical protein